jgi:putative ABC transport system substrate-binding protein
MRCHPVAIIVLLVLGICFALVPVDAQQPMRVPRIGLLDYTPSWEPLRQGLRDLGYVEGQNLILEYRSTDGRAERLPALAAELVQLPVDVIVTQGTPATLAARDATTTIPIVMIGAGDPIQNKLVASLAAPGGNIADLRAIRQPTLVVNGVRDELIPVSNSYRLVENLPNAALHVYPDAGHGSLFQYYVSFVRHATTFLESESPTEGW